MKPDLNSPVVLLEPLDAATSLVTLNRPERRNALSVELAEAFCQIMEGLAADPHQRVVILRGAAPMFCAGLDLHQTADPELAERGAHAVDGMLRALATDRLVTIAVAHGAAYAGGAGLMAACDFVVAADDLRVCFPEARRGLVPALILAPLTERLRRNDLVELLLLGEPIDAPRALRMGLVDRVVPAARALAEARSIAALLLRGGPETVRQTKQLLRRWSRTEPAARPALAIEFHLLARHSGEAHEGLSAFQEKRDPRWTA